jgi:hypothetical protein
LLDFGRIGPFDGFEKLGESTLFSAEIKPKTPYEVALRRG